MRLTPDARHSVRAGEGGSERTRQSSGSIVLTRPQKATIALSMSSLALVAAALQKSHDFLVGDLRKVLVP